MILSAKTVATNIQKKGFQENVGGKHILYAFLYNGKLTAIKTHMSHNNQDVDDFLQKQMAKQVYLTKKQFFDFASCKMSEEQYIKVLKNQGKL